MRAVAAILILSACSQLHAHRPRALKTIRNIVDCGLALGPSKCLSALTVWRANRALEHPNLKTNFTTDLHQFPWTKYSNSTDEELYSEACDGTERLLRSKALSLTVIPGYRFDLVSKGNGTLGVDVFRNAVTESGRGSMKKAKETFYQIMPFLVLPGLMMAALMPFVLPALKFLTIGAVMVNNMALSGAVFTLLRNNAFNDHYEHKVIYVNKGYQNEKYANKGYSKPKFGHLSALASNQHVKIQYPEIPEIDSIEELPFNSAWMKQYYGAGNELQIVDDTRIKREDKPNVSA